MPRAPRRARTFGPATRGRRPVGARTRPGAGGAASRSRRRRTRARGCCCCRRRGRWRHHIRTQPQLVLDELLKAGLLGLRAHPHRPAAQCAAGLGIEDLAQPLEALRRQIAAGVLAVTVGPIVVARRVDKRILERVEQCPQTLEALVAAGAATGLDVAEVQHDVDLEVAVDVSDEIGERGDLRTAVGRVADHRQRQGGRGGRHAPLAAIATPAAAAQHHARQQGEGDRDAPRTARPEPGLPRRA